MKYSIKTIATVAILFWSGVTFATNSDSVKENCQIKAEKENLYKVTYTGSGKEAVDVRIVDNTNQVVYSEKHMADTFTKKYDMSELPKGDYLIEVSSAGHTYTEAVAVGDLSDVNMNVTLRGDQRVALVGNNPNARKMTLYVLDEARNVLHEEQLADNLTLHKQYDLSSISEKKVTFLIYNQEQVVLEQSIAINK